MTVQKRADIVNFMQGLQKSGMPASEAIQLAIDLAEIKQGTWKKKQSLAEQKSDTLTEEEFDAAFEKGFNYDIMQEIREGYSEKLKEELTSGRAREESKDVFIKRANAEGYTTYEGERVTYGFRRAGDIQWGDRIQAFSMENLEEVKDMNFSGNRKLHAVQFLFAIADAK